MKIFVYELMMLIPSDFVAESQKREGYTFDDYKKDARLAFQKAKNRVYKAISEARRLKRLNGELEENSQFIKSKENPKDTMECMN